VTSLQVKQPVPVLMMSFSDLEKGSCFFHMSHFSKSPNAESVDLNKYQ